MKALIIMFLFGLLLQGEYSKSFEKKIDKALKKSFDSGVLTREKIDLKEDHLRPDPGLSLFAISDHSALLGYMIVTTVVGRYDYFDYCVIYGTNKCIRHIEILTYRSAHGYEITNKKWLGQFKGENGCDLEYGKQIDAIGGATLSASSLTSDITYLCGLMKSLPE